MAQSSYEDQNNQENKINTFDLKNNPMAKCCHTGDESWGHFTINVVQDIQSTRQCQ